MPRRIHSPAPSERFIAANTLPPITSATPSDVAAPAAYAISSSVVPTFAPCSAAPVSMRPRIGPAQGAHSRPVATPSSSDDKGPAGRPSRCASPVSRLPAATNGRVRCSATRGISRLRPKIASSTIAAQRPA
ncbi:hypothetical protein FEP82_05907 [Burkholderia multivorans]|nr:hypothetical protein [Burkholderia multivorans]